MIMKRSLNSLTCLFMVVLGAGPAAASAFSGVIATNTTWLASGSPYVLSDSVTVADGATLTLEPGAIVQLGANVDLVVTNGGRLLAEGTAAAPIRFTGAPNSKERWGGIVVVGGAGSPETRITYAQIAGNDFSAIYSAGGTILLDHLT